MAYFLPLTKAFAKQCKSFVEVLDEGRPEVLDKNDGLLALGWTTNNAKYLTLKEMVAPRNPQM